MHQGTLWREDLRRWSDLVLMLAWRDIAIKYKQSVMGFLWAILMPALVVGAGVAVQFVLQSYGGKPVDREGLWSVAVKSIPWAFVVASLRFSTNSLITNAQLVTKIYLPREVFPVAAVASQFADFCVASVGLATVLAVSGIGVSVQFLWIPVLVAGLVLLCIGLGILLSAGALFFRDVKYLIEVVITFAIFFTPVFYPVDVFGRFAEIAMLNPVAPLLVGLSDVIVYHRPPPTAWIGYSFGVALVACGVSWVSFKRLEPLFAERI